MQADVHGQPRLSITFDTVADRERFRVEAERQINASGLVLHRPGQLDLSETTICGVKVRVI